MSSGRSLGVPTACSDTEPLSFTQDLLNYSGFFWSGGGRQVFSQPPCSMRGDSSSPPAASGSLPPLSRRRASRTCDWEHWWKMCKKMCRRTNAAFSSGRATHPGKRLVCGTWTRPPQSRSNQRNMIAAFNSFVFLTLSVSGTFSHDCYSLGPWNSNCILSFHRDSQQSSHLQNYYFPFFHSSIHQYSTPPSSCTQSCQYIFFRLMIKVLFLSYSCDRNRKWLPAWKRFERRKRGWRSRSVNLITAAGQHFLSRGRRRRRTDGHSVIRLTITPSMKLICLLHLWPMEIWFHECVGVFYHYFKAVKK